MTEVGGRVIAALVVLTALGVAGCSSAPQSPQPTSAPTSTSHASVAPASRQSALPFTDLKKPWDVAVDSAGNVFVADTQEGGSRVVTLAAGSNTQTTLPQFVHASLVSDPAGTVWADDEKLVNLTAGPEAQSVLPSPSMGLHGVVLAMDAGGNLYGVNGGGVYPDGGCCVPVHVVKSVPGSDTATVLPFEHVDGMGGMAVDTAGNLYVGDASTERVLKLPAGANEPIVLPFNHIEGLTDLAVGAGGNVYVIDANHKRVLKLAAGSDTAAELSFEGLEHPVSVAVDSAENVYVLDGPSHRVVKLAAEES